MYALTLVTFFDMVPASKYAAYTSLNAMVLAFALLLGPLIGGAIVNFSTWRWTFLFNVPAAFVAMTLVFFTVPNHFQHQIRISDSLQSSGDSHIQRAFRRIDFLGVGLLLAACLLLITALQLAGRGFGWSSAVVIVFLVLSALLWPAFFCWEWFITREGGTREPVFPGRFLQNRVWVMMLL